MTRVLDLIGQLFAYKSPEPLTGERLRRYHLNGLSNKRLNEVLGVTPHIHCTNKRLIDLIIDQEYHKAANQ